MTNAICVFGVFVMQSVLTDFDICQANDCNLQINMENRLILDAFNKRCGSNAHQMAPVVSEICSIISKGWGEKCENETEQKVKLCSLIYVE